MESSKKAGLSILVLWVILINIARWAWVWRCKITIDDYCLKMKISWRYKMKCVLDCVFASFSLTLTIGASSWNGLWPRKNMQGPPPKRRQTLCGDTSCEGDCLHFAKFEENSSQFILIMHSFRSPFSRCWGSESIFYVTACACKCTYDTIFYTYAIHDTLFASLFVHMSGTVNMLHLHSMGPTSCWSNLWRTKVGLHRQRVILPCWA